MVTMMDRFDAQSLVDTYMSLPVKQRKHLERKAQSYIQALDQTIIQVLSPTIGKSDDQFLVTDDVIPLYGVGLSPEEGRITAPLSWNTMKAWKRMLRSWSRRCENS